MSDFERLQAALDALREYYKENGSDFVLRPVLRDLGFGGEWLYQTLIRYGLAKHQSKSLGGGWRIDTHTSLHSAMLYRAISKEPEDIRNELYDYVKGLEAAAEKVTDSQ